jgi:hypothetical protein
MIWYHFDSRYLTAISSQLSPIERFDVVILACRIDSLAKELHELWAEIVSIEGVVDIGLEKSELIPCIIAISLHLESVYFFTVSYHPFECVGESDLSIFAC